MSQASWDREGVGHTDSHGPTVGPEPLFPRCSQAPTGPLVGRGARGRLDGGVYVFLQFPVYRVGRTFSSACVCPLRVKSRDEHSFRYLHGYSPSRLPTGNRRQARMWGTGGVGARGRGRSLGSAWLRGGGGALAGGTWGWGSCREGALAGVMAPGRERRSLAGALPARTLGTNT